MTDQEKKRIFEYCGFEIEHECKCLEAGLGRDCIKSKNPILLHCLPDDDKPCIYHYEVFRNLNGNDILEAVSIMEKKGDWEGFYTYTWCHKSVILSSFFIYLFQNFFQLLSDWLEARQ